MSANDPRVRLAGALRAHLAARVSTLLQASRDTRVHAGFTDPASFHAWRQHATPEQVAAAYGQARGMGVGAGKTAAFRNPLHRLVAEGARLTGEENDR